MMTTPPQDGWIECGGEFLAADVIRFEEAVWRRGKRIGRRVWIAQVLDIEGPEEEAWVYLEAISCAGVFPEAEGHHFRRKRRNVERNGVERRPWDDESARALLVAA